MPDEEQNINFIKCGNDGLAPWSVVCIHLASGECREWLTIPSNNPEVDFDYLCPKCMEKFESGSNDISNWRPACIHCVVRLRREFDPNFVEPEIIEI